MFIKLVPSWLKAAPHVVSFLGFSLKCLFFPGMSIVLAVAEGEVFVNDAEIQKSALQVVINCVCAPDKRMSSIGKFIAGSPRRRVPQQTKASESVLTKMWNVVQSNNGIKVELNGGLKVTVSLCSQLILNSIVTNVFYRCCCLSWQWRCQLQTRIRSELWHVRLWWACPAPALSDRSSASCLCSAAVTSSSWWKNPCSRTNAANTWSFVSSQPSWSKEFLANRCWLEQMCLWPGCRGPAWWLSLGSPSPRKSCCCLLGTILLPKAFTIQPPHSPKRLSCRCRVCLILQVHPPISPLLLRP